MTWTLASIPYSMFEQFLDYFIMTITHKTNLNCRWHGKYNI
jgi:hypothetical protein